MKLTETNIAKEAVDRVGGQSSLARLVGVQPQAVQQWVDKGYIPTKRALAVSKATRIPIRLLLSAVENKQPKD